MRDLSPIHFIRWVSGWKQSAERQVPQKKKNNNELLLLYSFRFKIQQLCANETNAIIITIIIVTTNHPGHAATTAHSYKRNERRELTKLNNQTKSPVLLLLVNNKMKF